MFIPNAAYLNDDRTPTNAANPLPRIPPVKSDLVVERAHSRALHCEEVNLNFKQNNCFSIKLLCVLSVGVLVLALLIWAFSQLWLYFGGGSLGTG